MKVLITGGAGFIGSHTVDLFIKKGHSVIVLDNFDYKIHGKERPNYLNNKAIYIKGDVRKKRDWLKAGIEFADIIIHLAAHTDAFESFIKPQKYIQNNVNGTALMYELLIQRNLKPKHILVASSEAVYGEGTYKCESCKIKFQPKRSLKDLKSNKWDISCPDCGKVLTREISREIDAPNLTSIYALSKYAQEQMVMYYGRALGIDSTATRYFNVYGPRQSLRNPYSGVCMNIISKIKSNMNILLNEDGNQLRDFVYVEDVARANYLSVFRHKGYEIFNVGSGKKTSLISLSNIFCSLVGYNKRPIITYKYREGDVRSGGGDISKIKNIGYIPTMDLETGILNLLKYEKIIK